MSKSTGRRPLRTLVLVALAIAAVLGFRAAVADRGGSYDPAERTR